MIKIIDKIMTWLIKIVSNIQYRLNNATDKNKMILGYICICLLLLGPISLIIELIIKLF